LSHLEKVSGKSIVSLLLLAAGCGTMLTVHAHGHDAPQALEALGSIIEGYLELGLTVALTRCARLGLLPRLFRGLAAVYVIADLIKHDSFASS
jgi:hypothetical protein